MMMTESLTTARHRTQSPEVTHQNCSSLMRSGLGGQNQRLPGWTDQSGHGDTTLCQHCHVELIHLAWVINTLAVT